MSETLHPKYLLTFNGLINAAKGQPIDDPIHAYGYNNHILFYPSGLILFIKGPDGIQYDPSTNSIINVHWMSSSKPTQWATAVPKTYVFLDSEGNTVWQINISDWTYQAPFWVCPCKCEFHGNGQYYIGTENSIGRTAVDKILFIQPQMWDYRDNKTITSLQTEEELEMYPIYKEPNTNNYHLNNDSYLIGTYNFLTSYSCLYQYKGQNKLKENLVIGDQNYKVQNAAKGTYPDNKNNFYLDNTMSSFDILYRYGAIKDYATILENGYEDVEENAWYTQGTSETNILTTAAEKKGFIYSNETSNQSILDAKWLDEYYFIIFYLANHQEYVKICYIPYGYNIYYTYRQPNFTKIFPMTQHGGGLSSDIIGFGQDWDPENPDEKSGNLHLIMPNEKWDSNRQTGLEVDAGEIGADSFARTLYRGDFCVTFGWLINMKNVSSMWGQEPEWVPDEDLPKLYTVKTYRINRNDNSRTSTTVSGLWTWTKIQNSKRRKITYGARVNIPSTEHEPESYLTTHAFNYFLYIPVFDGESEDFFQWTTGTEVDSDSVGTAPRAGSGNWGDKSPNVSLNQTGIDIDIYTAVKANALYWQCDSYLDLTVKLLPTHSGILNINDKKTLLGLNNSKTEQYGKKGNLTFEYTDATNRGVSAGVNLDLRADCSQYNPKFEAILIRKIS